jgi:hypothetical protein
MQINGGYGDPQDVLDGLDENATPQEMLEAQLKINQMMMLYQAASQVIKSTYDCMTAMARNM